MKALVAQAIGQGVSALGLHDVAVPEVGDDDVKIKVAAVSASQLDLSVLAGRIPGVTPPIVLGIDPVGTVVEAGRNVAPGRVGAMVAVKPNIACHRCRYCDAGRESDCVWQRMLGVHLDGGAAEFVVVPSWSAFDVPSGMDSVTACASVHTFPVALHMLQAVADKFADPTPTTVLASGATGAVGSAAVQLAHSRGATVIGAIRGLERAEAVRAIGADHIIDISSARAAERVADIAPDGVDVALETTGNSSVAARCFATLGWTGRMVTCAGGRDTLPIALGALYRNRRGLLGVAASDAGDVVEGLRLVADRVVAPVIDRVVDLADFGAAYQAMSRGRHRNGRIVFKVSL